MEWNFYVDNCLQSLPSDVQAKELVDHLQSLLMEGELSCGSGLVMFLQSLATYR